MSAQKIELKTSDGVKIAANFYPGNTFRGIILLHMMPSTKESWQDFATKLQSVGFHALAIDLRGHGQSGGGNYKQFTDEQHQASIKDLESAAQFLQEKGVSDLCLAGASIGANLSLQYLAENPKTKSVILLSPGLDYRGIKSPDLAAKVSDKNKILFVGSEDDADSMEASCEEMIEKLGTTKSICYDTGGHGTNLLQTHPELTGQLLDFLLL